MQSEAIYNLQVYLKQLSYTDPTIQMVPIDGIYDTETRNAVIAFQSNHGLKSDGGVDKITWDAIYAEYLDSIINNSKPLAVNFFPRNTQNQTLHIGDIGFKINLLQYMLRELSIYYGEIFDIDISGIYDIPTENAIKEFQRLNSIFENGYVDLNTWNRITEHYNAITTEYIQ